MLHLTANASITLKVGHFCPRPAASHINRSADRRACVRALRGIRASLFLDNRPCGAGLPICLGGANQGRRRWQPWLMAFRISSEPGSTGIELVSACERPDCLGRYTCQPVNARSARFNQVTVTLSFHDDRMAPRWPCRKLRNNL
jgi:hypothetical protein